MKRCTHILCLGGVIAACFSGCGKDAPPARPDRTDGATTQSPPATNSSAAATAAQAEVPIYSYEIVHTYPHDTNAFTQGLVYLDGVLWESTGLNGQSSLRKVELETGKVLKEVKVPEQYFAEGLAILDQQAFQLTWQNQKGFVYDRKSFNLKKEFTYEGEGWGLTTDGRVLILSDGTDELRFLDPVTFAVQRRVQVRYHGRPVNRLNELEFVKGEILANVWITDLIARIDPASGNVTGVINLTGLLAPSDRGPNTDVLNGIAYDAAKDRLFVTGKKWPKLFEIRLKLTNQPQRK